MKNKKKLWIGMIPIILIIIIVMSISLNYTEIKSIHSEKQLMKLYRGYRRETSAIERILLLPFSALVFDYQYDRVYETNQWNAVEDGAQNEIKETTAAGTKDYSKTNIQVENVDEADIIKTDGDYIYSISEKKVIITNVKNPENVEIASSIEENAIPNDMVLYNNTLVVISSNVNGNYYTNNTIVSIYNIKNKNNPKKIKSFELYEPYYTTRCIDGRLYVFSKGYLRVENDHVVREYKEDKTTKELKLRDMKYIKNNPTNIQSLIAEIDLDNPNDSLKIQSYLMNISDSYISEKNIYLLSEKDQILSIKDLLGLGGVIGFFKNMDLDYENNTSIFKFKMDQKKGILYSGRANVEGSVVNQYSLDEKDENLRIALESNKGTRVVILNKYLKELGHTDYVGKGERMYSSRFMKDKAYLVTYRNTDPLFVMDLSDVRHPKVMGELSVPGYSTYLHPYDENHLIGIGMESEETIRRDQDGRVITTGATITGMKMSLFDVSDIQHPKQLDKTTIGDSRTVSAILTNPKALLFSKEKSLLAIPVNNYAEDFTSNDSDEYEYEIDDFISNSDSYISEGYFVYHIDLDNGFQLKGIINHDKSTNRYYYYYDSKLLRGVYIDDNLYTVSEDEIKVHRIEDLKPLSSLIINEKGKNENEK